MKTPNEPQPFFQGTGDVLLHWPDTSFQRTQASLQRAAEDARRLADAGNDRSFAIMTALLVEEAVEGCLRAWMPGYDDEIAEDFRTFTFSARVSVLKALRLVPSQLLEAADTVRDVRNAFAHHLAATTFEQLPKKKQDSLDGKFRRILGAYVAYRRERLGKQFDMLARLSIAGLRDYQPRIKDIRDRLPPLVRRLEAETRNAWRAESKDLLPEAVGPMRSYFSFDDRTKILLLGPLDQDAEKLP